MFKLVFLILLSGKFIKNVNEKRGKFLEKLWCCVGGKYNRIIWFYQLG